MGEVEIEFDDDLSRQVELHLASRGVNGLRPDQAISIQTLREVQQGVETTSRLATRLDDLEGRLSRLNHCPVPDIGVEPTKPGPRWRFSRETAWWASLFITTSLLALFSVTYFLWSRFENLSHLVITIETR